MSMTGPMQSSSVAAAIDRTTAHIVARQCSRARARSSGATCASSMNALSRAGTTKRYGPAGGAAPAGRTTSVTGSMDVVR